MYKTYCTQWTVLLRKGRLLRIYLEEFRVSFITFGIIGKITKQITILANKDYSDLIFLFLTCFMLYKDVSKTRVRNIMTCFLFMSQMPESSEIPRFEFPLPLSCAICCQYHWIFWVIFDTKQNRVYILDYLFYMIFILSVLIDNRVNRLAGILPVIIRSKNQRDANFFKTEQNTILSIFKTDATLKYLTNFYTCNILCLVQLPKKPTMKHLWEF